jgi:serine protease Do
MRVTVAELAEEPAEQAAAPPGDERGSTDFGFDIADVPPALRERLGLGEAGGALVTQVHGGGPAETAGMQRGDVILEVDGAPVAGGRDAEAKLRKAGDKTLLLVLRDEATVYVAVRRRER